MTFVQQNSATPSPPHQGPTWLWYGTAAVFAVVTVGLLMACLNGAQAQRQAMRSPGAGLQLGHEFWVTTGLLLLAWVGSGLWLLGTYAGASRTERCYVVGAGVSAMALVESTFVLMIVMGSLERPPAMTAMQYWLPITLSASGMVGLAWLACWCALRLERCGQEVS